MNQEEIADQIKAKITVSEEALDFFFKQMSLRKLSKNQHLIKEGGNEVHFILVKSGCLMTYFKAKGHIHVIQFGSEMWWTGDMKAFTEDETSFYSIKAMRDSEVYLMDKVGLHKLLQKVPAFQEYFRIIFQNALISHQKRIVRNISYSAEEKYLEFIYKYPDIEQIVAQKYIASFIGITPEFLSKLKRKLAEKKIA
ncbi:MAG: CRP-like cAMP-binding protein [Marivirga sp.]|jgi:CRP-like cAMP-binding protein